MGLLPTSCCPAPGREKTKLKELALDHRVTGDRFYSYVSTVGQRLSQKAPSLEEGVLFTPSQDMPGGAESSAESECPSRGRPRGWRARAPRGVSTLAWVVMLPPEFSRHRPPGQRARLPFLELQDARVHGSSAGFQEPGGRFWNGQVLSRPVGEQVSFPGAPCDRQASCVRRLPGGRPPGCLLERWVGGRPCRPLGGVSATRSREDGWESREGGLSPAPRFQAT